MSGPVRAVVQMGSAVAEMVLAKAGEVADAVLKQGAALVSTSAAGQAGAFGEEVLAAARANRATIVAVVREEVEKAVDGALSGSAGDLERARTALRQLTVDLDELRGQVAAVPLLGSAAAAGVAGLSQAAGLAERVVGRGGAPEDGTTAAGDVVPGEVSARSAAGAGTVRRLDPAEVLRASASPAAPRPRRTVRTAAGSSASASTSTASTGTDRQAAPRKRATRKTAAATSSRKSPAADRQTAAQKATAQTAPAKKATATRTAATRATPLQGASSRGVAPTKRAPAQTATTKKAATTKAATKKATPTKAATKKATAQKSATKKAATKKAATRKAATPASSD